MDTLSFSKFLADTEALTQEQRQSAMEHIQKMMTSDNNQRVIEESLQEHAKCPHCSCLDFVRFGITNGQQRYRCKSCKRTFIALTGTSLAYVHDKAKLLDHAASMAQGLTIRKTAEAVGLTVDRAFRWRHRFLEYFREQKPQAMTGVVEADEIFFRRSYKGQRKNLPRKAKKRGGPSKSGGANDIVPVLVAIQRGTRIEADTILDNLSKKSITSALRPMLSSDAILSTDGNGSYSYAAGKLGVKFGYFVASIEGPGGNAIWHVQSVNAYASRLRNWMVRFRGVATKYLGNYLGWRRLFDKLQDNVTPQQFLFHTLHRGYINT